VARTRDLSRRIRTDGTDELSRLGASFNTMLEALANAERSQRQLVADASHELRTPLTSLRTNIEVMSSDMLAPDDKERLLRDLIAQLDELTVLVADLVDLARDDEPDAAAEDVRLDTLVSDAVERARRHAADKVFFTDLHPCLVEGVPGRLDRAVTNLLDNAAKWSPPGGQIEVTVSDGEVRVRDHGPGIADSDLPYVFDRFYRAPAARGLPGSGLGLAIVRQVAEAHGGTVMAERANGGGASMRLKLPVAD
jgi:two-component system sensor histidine kinase MprB